MVYLAQEATKSPAPHPTPKVYSARMYNNTCDYLQGS